MLNIIIQKIRELQRVLDFVFMLVIYLSLESLYVMKKGRLISC